MKKLTIYTLKEQKGKKKITHFQMILRTKNIFKNNFKLDMAREVG